MNRYFPSQNSRYIAVLTGFFILLLSACGNDQQIITPSFSNPADMAPAGAAQMLYVTDRAPENDAGPDPSYGHQRDPAMASGEVTLNFIKKPHQIERVKLTGTTEILKFPATPLPFSAKAGVIVPDKAASRAYANAAERFKAQVAQKLRASGNKEIVIFVHGYHYDFGDSMIALAQIWQATGRSVLPLAYSWPAGNPGLFGYFKDRESGSYSIFHFKQTLKLLAQVEGLESIHIIAHSRGTDLVTTALREMIIGIRASGRNPRDVLKIDNLILAAPDLDFGVVSQRLIAEQFGPAFECVTVYMNPKDSALGLAQTLMSGTRFGRLTYDQLNDVERKIFRQIGNVYFIDVSSVADPTGHSYFRKNPEVLADIVALLKTSALPGSRDREMTHINANFWSLISEEQVLAEINR